MKILAIIIVVMWLTGIIRLVVGLLAYSSSTDSRPRKASAVRFEEESDTGTTYWPNEFYKVGSLPSEQGRLSVFTELDEPPERTSLSEDTPYDSWSSSDY